MIDPGSYAAYLTAAFVLLVIPGPTILTVVAYGLRLGPRAAWASAGGVLLGDAIAVTASLTGLGALMALSPALFNVVKWLGAGYLLWLALQSWLESLRVEGPAEASTIPADVSLVDVFKQNAIVTALNPKGIVFFFAFIPQFVRDELAYWPQVIIYGSSFVVLGGLNALAYAYSAGRLAAFFTKPGPMRWMKRAAALFLASAAIYTLFAQIKG